MARCQFLLSALALILAFAPVTYSASKGQSDEEQAREQLKDLQREIRAVTKQISTEKNRKSSLQNQLRKADIELGALQKNIAQNESALQTSRKELADLNGREQVLIQSRDAQQALVAREIRSAYQMGRQGQLKILLNQDDPNTLARALTYYQYFYQARGKHIDRYREILTELKKLEVAIVKATNELENKKQTLKKQQKNLINAKKTRELAVSNLLASIASKDGKLKQMQQDQQELKHLLEAIEKAVVNLKMPENYKSFSAAKGSMPWPISGRASHRFGNSRNSGKMRWQGVTIPAKAGVNISAIHHGRVVYADWLRGSGLLLIIDHGDDYMSLYAHNQSLLAEVGEWVNSGSTIATVGSSGGQDRPALYFEVRHKGKPVNPASWCRR
jgi:septal ring factor EnvC (AmiA/AmiB activator)